MQLTNAQKNTLRTFVQNDPTLNAIPQTLANTTTGGAGNGAEATPAKLRVEGSIEWNYLREVMGW